MTGVVSNASIATLNTKVLQISDENEARCHLSKHTNWIAEDLRTIEVQSKYITEGLGLPNHTKPTIDMALANYGGT